MRYLKLLVPSLLAAAALTVAPSAAPSIGTSSYSHYYVDEFTLSNAIESKGITYHSRHVAVDTSFCIGLRRYGVRTIDYQDNYWRFKCDISAANGHMYEAQVSTTNGPRSGVYYWHLLNVALQF